MNRYVDLPYAFCSRRLTIRRTTWALALVAATLAPVASAAVTDITCPAAITSSGRYRLAADCALTTPNSTGIGIGASDVHLNLGGHTISGPGCSTQGTSVGILVNGSNVHVHGGTVEGFTLGIQVAADDNHLNGLTVTENCQGLILGADDNHVDGNDVSSNFAEGVFVLGGSINNVINENVINDNGAGFLVLDSDNNVIRSNDISRNTNAGLSLIQGSDNNTILGNSVNDHVLRNGITVSVSNNNTIRENTANGNHVGIQLLSGVSGNVIRVNMAANNTLSDLADEDVQPPSSICNDLWRNNTFATDNEGDGPGAGCIR